MKKIRKLVLLIIFPTTNGPIISANALIEFDIPIAKGTAIISLYSQSANNVIIVSNEVSPTVACKKIILITTELFFVYMNPSLSITKKFDNITAKVNSIYQEISSLKNSIDALNTGFEILQSKQNNLEKQVAKIEEEVKRKQDVILRPVKLIGIIPSRTGDYIYIFDVAG